jgi:Plasmid pRiA4b ORF-3-like protein
MSVNLHQLDQIQDYDQAIAALDGFIEELVLEFVASIEAQTYLQSHPVMQEYVGSWIDHLLYFGYAYESVTLPQMTMKNVEVVVTQLFPRKISLFDPTEADTAIPELIAFWQFLKREYQHPQAHKIIKFLKQIQPKFSSMMNDSSNFGVAKSFLMSGMAAGFDMTTEAGIKQFQKQQKQPLAPLNSSANLPNIADLVDLFDGLGLPGIESLSQVEPAALEQMLRELAQEILAEFPQEVPSAQEFQAQIQGNLTQKIVQLFPEATSPSNGGTSRTEIKVAPLSSSAIAERSQREIAILQQQEITETIPGTILQDFQTLLDFIGQKGIAVGGKLNLIPMKSLTQINQQLAEPIQTDLQRPQQKSYPTINGLYLLLRATAIAKIVQEGKKTQLRLDPLMVNNWQQMNLTERYFNLLEAWLVIAQEEMLGARGHMTEGSRCLMFWSKMPSKGEKFPNYQTQQNLKYYPGFHNLALMKLFGLIEASYGKPEVGKGWRVKSVKQTAWGKALLQAAFPDWTLPIMTWDDEQSVDPQFGQLQPVLQPYFPQWQKIIELPQITSRTGVYLFKVTWHQIWRRIAISSDMTLWDLSQLILQSVDFDSDHLDLFTYKNRLGLTMQAFHPYMNDFPSTDEIKIADLPLEIGSVMEYLFDFGDNWEFELLLEEVKSDLRPGYGEIIASQGKAPEQYPDWGEY